MIRLSVTLMPASQVSRVVKYYTREMVKLKLGVTDGHLQKNHTKYELGKVENTFVS